MSKPTTELAGIDTPGTIVTPSKAMVAVEADVAALDNTMFETTVIVDVVGTVYSVVLVVAAAVLAIAFVTVAISYYLSFLECFHKKQD